MNMKLLIADDNPAIHSVIRNILSDLFDEITECDDGSEAIKNYEAHQHDWVLMDIEMKIMDGLEASRIILKKYPYASIIIVSQYNDRNTIEDSLKIGIIDFVSKENLTRIPDIIGNQELKTI